jgi:hypothetical protein
MATVSIALRQVKARLGELVSHEEVFKICRQTGHVWRDRLLNPAVTIELFLLQLLAGVAMAGLRHVAGIEATESAICQAKKRLPLWLLMELVGRSVPAEQAGEQSLWKGLMVYLADGMSFLVQDTAPLAAQFGKASNQRGTSHGYPVPKLLALMDLTGGFIRRVVAMPAARQEYTCLSRLFSAVGCKGLLLGDRGLVSFTHLALLLDAGVHGCFRLPRGRVVRGAGKGNRRRIAKLGKQDLLVRWMPTARPAWLSARRWVSLSQRQLELRQISYRICRRGFRVQWAWIITTLTDPQQYPAQDLVELYSKRWQIEMCHPYCLHCHTFEISFGQGLGRVKWAA